MPINEDANGRNHFDPSKRIRGTLGKDFVEGAEADAFAKLSLVANASGMRSEEKPEDISTNNGVKVNRFNIYHTSNNVPFTPAKSVDAVSQRLYSKDNQKKNLILGYKNDDIKLPIINNILGTIPTLGFNYVKHNGLENGFKTSDIGKLGLFAGAQFGIDALTRFNTVEYNKYFADLDFSKADISVINHTAFVENLKFSAAKIVKDMVAPTAISMALNKFLPKTVTSNTIYKVAVNDVNLPRVATSVIGSIIYNQYAKKVYDKAFKVESSIKDVAKACAIKDIMSRKAISELGIEAVFNVGNRLADIVANKTSKTISTSSGKPKPVVKSIPKSTADIKIQKKPTTEPKKKTTATTSSTKKVA